MQILPENAMPEGVYGVIVNAYDLAGNHTHHVAAKD
ncbi:hypothetical protein CVH13_01354, partial [Dehalococcoides mccartyi]